MTVVLSLMCADGVVIAADSQITDSNRGMSFPGQKLPKRNGVFEVAVAIAGSINQHKSDRLVRSRQ